MLSQYYRQVRQDERPIRYFVEDESRFGLKTIVGRLITAFVDIASLVPKSLNAKLNKLFSALVILVILPIILSYFPQSDLV